MRGMSYVSSHIHCVFSTKERRPIIAPELRERLWPFMGGIARQNQMKAIEIGGVADHRVNLSRPFGTCAHRPSDPNVETLGYYRKSLRDKPCVHFASG